MRGIALLAGIWLFAPSAVRAQTPRLGTIDFPTSGAAAAQPSFIRGVLYLHSFEYPKAAAAFREAQRLDPGFVMAYWGEAMTYTHPVWNQQDRDSALDALRRLAPTLEARRERAATPRERGYLAAVEILYGDGPKARRDTLYSRAMLELMENFPADLEARAFAALSILGLSQAVRDVPAYMRAAALAAPVFAANPDHPGAAHYLIHAFDDPIHAPLGLPAARAYARIAPDAAHAQHMTTHIFLALGMWDETISQNIIAADQTAYVPGHYTEWLAYGYLQAGKFRDATALLDRVRAAMSRNARQRSALAFMRAQHVVNTEDWGSAAWSWQVEVADAPLFAAIDVFARGLAAARRREPAALTAAVRAMVPPLTALRAAGDTLATQKAVVMERELRALSELLRNNGAGAVDILQEAAQMQERLPMDYGPPEIVKPVHELLGETLLELRRPAEAQRAFTRALEMAPGRARSLIGLMRAADAVGDRDVAATASAELTRKWRGADGAPPARNSSARSAS